jgi:hypothetical protein
VINGKDWPRTLDNIHEFLTSILGDTGAPLAYVIRVDITVSPEANYPLDAYLMVDQEITYRAPYYGTAVGNDDQTVWDCMKTSAPHISAGSISSM